MSTDYYGICRSCRATTDDSMFSNHCDFQIEFAVFLMHHTLWCGTNKVTIIDEHEYYDLPTRQNKREKIEIDYGDDYYAEHRHLLEIYKALGEMGYFKYKKLFEEITAYYKEKFNKNEYVEWYGKYVGVEDTIK